MKKKTGEGALLLLLGLGLVLATPHAELSTVPSQDTLEHILAELKTYEYGSNDDLLLHLNACVSRACGDAGARQECERQLLHFLESEATLTAKMEICRHLRRMGGERSIPVMERLLYSEETSDMARYALECIPGESADRAVLRMLDNAPKGTLTGIISSIGHRKVAEAVPKLQMMLQSPDPEIASAAIIALGHISGLDALSALMQAMSDAEGRKLSRIVSSLLKCAEEFHLRNQEHEAGRIYDGLISADLPDHLRGAALRGRIAVLPRESEDTILNVLKGNDRTLYTAALSMVPLAVTGSSVKELCLLLPDLPPAHQAQLLAVLGGYKKREVQDAAVSALEYPEFDVRLAALGTLGKLGNAASVGILARHAAKAQYREQKAARNSLWKMPGKRVDRAVLKELEESQNPSVQIELIKTIGERRIVAGSGLLRSLAQNADAEMNRVEAIKALGIIAPPSDLPSLLDLFLEAKGERERQHWVAAIADVVGRIEDPSERGRMVSKKIAGEKDIRRRRSLYRVLGRIGDNSTLPVLREALSDTDEKIRETAVRVLARWPNPGPKRDLLAIAEKTDDPALQVLALRSHIRMIGEDTYNSPEEAVALLQAALSISRRPEEKLYVLGQLQQYPCLKALKLAESLVPDEDVGREAMIAVDNIQEKIK